MENLISSQVAFVSSEDDFDALLNALHLEIITESISDIYTGHSRCEKISTIENVTYYNDSLSLSIKNTEEALKFVREKRILWIMNESDKISGLHQLGQLIQEKIIGIIVIGDDTCQTMLKLLDYCGFIVSARSIAEAIDLSSFFTANIDAIIYSPSSSLSNKAERNEDQGAIFKKAVKTLEISKRKDSADFARA